MKKVLLGGMFVLILGISVYFTSVVILDNLYIKPVIYKPEVNENKGFTGLKTSENNEDITKLNMESKLTIEYLNKHKDRPLYKREIFMTFDDGPSYNTRKVIKILDSYSVKANFFEIGKNIKGNEDIVKLLQQDGMCILNHSYNHDYNSYKSVDSFNVDFKLSKENLAKVLGKDALPFFRFPGGSDNQQAIDYTNHYDRMKDMRNDIKAFGEYYVDWNVSSGDAAPGGLPMETIKNNIINQASSQNFVVSLMHDAEGKDTSMEALPYIVENLKQQGFVFRTFEDITPTEINEMIRLRIVNRTQKGD